MALGYSVVVLSLDYSHISEEVRVCVCVCLFVCASLPMGVCSQVAGLAQSWAFPNRHGHSLSYKT